MDYSKRIIIGRREWFSFPELGIPWIQGKIDTGARTSSLHATRIETFWKGEDQWVRFRTVDRLDCEAQVIFEKKVRSSNGRYAYRFFIEVEAETLDGKKHVVLLSLTSRKKMKCPLLLGRRALAPFLVDCKRSNLLGKHKTKRN